MVLTNEQTERACGFVLLSELNLFTYCCKICAYEFALGTQLEEHILREHQDVKGCIENVFVSGGSFDSMSQEFADDSNHFMTIDEIKQEIEMEPTTLQEPDFKNDTESSGILGVFVNENYGMLGNELFGVKSEESNGKSRKDRPIKAQRISRTAKYVPHFDMNRYYCDMCPIDEVHFTLKADLKKHIIGHKEKKMRPCPICNEITENIMKHVRTQHPGLNEKPYKCTHCEKSFSSEHLQMNHIRTHTGERPYLCADCGSSFITGSALKSHIKRIHKSGKVMPYSCNDCDLSFSLRYKFEHHRLSVHCDERPYFCDVCKDRFKSQNTLRNHKSTHGERTNTCRFCQKKFKTNDYKRHHERKVHGDGYRGNQRKYFR